MVLKIGPSHRATPFCLALRSPALNFNSDNSLTAPVSFTKERSRYQPRQQTGPIRRRPTGRSPPSSDGDLNMRFRNSPQGYGAIAMALHWTIVALVLGAWFSGQFGEELPRGASREAGLFVHITFGLVIVAFAAVRLSWRLSDPPPTPERSPHGAWGEWTGKTVHYLIYVALIAIPAVGIVALFARGHALPFFGLFELASPWSADRAFAHEVKEVHEFLANAMMTLIGGHAAAALVHHYVFRDRTLVRMLPVRRF
jgi:cytochrome b561